MDADVLVIGSGVGGLTAAALLARSGRRVILLERQRAAGGLSHSFTREGRWRWDVGLSAVASMGPDEPLRRLMDKVTGGAVDWVRVPEPSEVFEYPGLRFSQPGARGAYAKALLAAFPGQGLAVESYLSAVDRASGWMGREMMSRTLPPLLARVGHGLNTLTGGLGQLTLGRWLQDNVPDPRLRGLLASQWVVHGLPPARVSFATHATIAKAYLDGSWYPVGGAWRIAEAAVAVLEEAGGELRTGHRATELLFEGGRAAGVKVRVEEGGPEELILRAPTVISDAGAWTTYVELMPEGVLPHMAEAVRAFTLRHPPATLVSLYLGLSGDPRPLGFSGGDHHLFHGFDHDAAYGRRNAWLSDPAVAPPLASMSFPSLRDPAAGEPAVEVLSVADHAAFEPLRDDPGALAAVKERVADALIAMIDDAHPGFADLVAYREVATPLTVERSTGHRRGAVYGIAAVPARFDPDQAPFIGPRTPAEGLWLTGVDAMMEGVPGALMGGAVCASLVPEGPSLGQLFSEG